MRTRATPLLLGVTLALGCGDAEPPSFPRIDEPTEALRPPEQRGEVPESAHIVDYRIQAKLDGEAHRIDGKLRMQWRNATNRTVKQLPFHLYMNGFRADDTTWMAESRGAHRGEKMDEKAWGYVDVKSVKQLSRADALAATLPELEFDPDAAKELTYREDADPTTMTVELPEPVGPEQVVTLEIEFVTQLPRVFARTGYFAPKEGTPEAEGRKCCFHMVGQWFPKIGVLEEAAGWQAHTFTLNSEFYADFGTYDVTLDVPEEMVVGATGIRVGETVADGRKVLDYHAEMVHDFAWTADPNYVEHFGEHEGIRIRQLIQPTHVDDAEAHLEIQKQTLDSMQRRFGPYPWSTITIVHAPAGAEGAGGMEYPTLYTTSDIFDTGMPPWLLEERVTGLFTTVHEFGHQYFQGLFASNEHRQPWLDEGMNTTSNMLTMMDAFESEDPWLAKVGGHEMTIDDLMRLSVRESLLDPVDQAADGYRKYVGSYGSMVYQKTGALMLTLRNLVGHDAWDAALAEYAKQARFQHPRGGDLERVLVETLGSKVAVAGDGGPGTVWLDVQDYLDQALREVSAVDFAVHTISAPPLSQGVGYHRDEANELQLTAPPEREDEDAPLPDEEVEGTVVVHRKGDFRVPVELMVQFRDGSTETVVWDGQERYHIFRWPGKRVTLARLDPNRKLFLEARRLDNTAYREAPGESEPDDGLSDFVGDMAEASSLAIVGVLGP